MDALDLIKEGKIKRYFRATRKLNHPNLISHITQRAAGKEPLFIEAIRISPFDSKPESRKAKKYIIEQLIDRGYKRAEIVERLGLSRKTVYNILKSPL